MPIKKSRSKAVLTPVKDRVPAIVPRRSAFWTVFAFMMVSAAVIAVGAGMYLLYQQQLLMSASISNLDTRVALIGQSKAASRTQSLESQVKGIYLQYRPCEAGFTGACDDAALFKLAEDGTKQVVLPSLRSLPGSPLTGELLQPISQSADGRYLVLGAWSFGAERGENDRRIWLYDFQLGTIVARADVPAGAVFSPDYTYAAYAGSTDGDIRDLMVANVRENKVVSGAKAADDRTFMGPDKRASIRWVDAKTVAIKEFTKPAEGAPSQEKGEVTIKLK